MRQQPNAEHLQATIINLMMQLTHLNMAQSANFLSLVLLEIAAEARHSPKADPAP